MFQVQLIRNGAVVKTFEREDPTSLVNYMNSEIARGHVDYVGCTVNVVIAPAPVPAPAQVYPDLETDADWLRRTGGQFMVRGRVA
jgi:hypothetical protein